MFWFNYTHDTAYVHVDEEWDIDERKNVPIHIINEMNAPNKKIIFPRNEIPLPCGPEVSFNTNLIACNNVVGIGSNILNNVVPDENNYRRCKIGYEQTEHFVRSVTIPDGIKFLSRHAFYGETVLHTVLLPQTLLFCGEGCFAHTHLKNINLPSALGYIGDYCFDSTMLGEVHIPDSVEYLGHCAFQSCKHLMFCKLPKSLKMINSNCFRECYKLEGIDIPNSVENVKQNAFEASGLRSISFQEGLTSIQSQAFSECESLFSVALPRSVSYIADDAFDPPEKNPLLTFYVYPGSYGLMWAREHGYPVKSAEI